MKLSETTDRSEACDLSRWIEETTGSHPDFTEIKDTEDMWLRKKGSITLEARFFVHRCGEFRSVHISGPKIEIINAFFFPYSRADLPVYAMEIVVFGQKPVVGVIDLECSGTSTSTEKWSQEKLQDLHNQYPNLQQGTDPPEWFQECRSGNDFFIRPQNTAELVSLERINRALWEQVSLRIDAISDDFGHSDTPSAFSPHVVDYKLHHKCNSPGLPFLNRTFGKDWTERFLGEHLFV